MRALSAMLATVYGRGAQLDRDLVAAWALLVIHWPPAGQQEDQPELPASS